MIELFKLYPTLSENMPHTRLIDSPTPVQLIEPLNTQLGVNNLYVKRDDLTNPVYGGNKVRKLEFLLGKALQDGLKEVLTYGGAGSNHALATAIHSRRVGLSSISLLSAQPNARSVRRNLLRGYLAGAELHHFMSWSDALEAECEVCDEHEQKTGKRPYPIPAGGSSPLGAVGFVNAALELKSQINAGEMPEPDRIYVACGTMSTCMGLLIGLKVAGLKTVVHAIQVTAPGFCNLERGIELFLDANQLLHEADSAFPVQEFPTDNLVLRPEFFGPDYAVHTPEGIEAIQQTKESGIKLEGTYTGKAFAALIADARRGDLKGKTAFFWNTYNSNDFLSEIENIDYHELPQEFHRYFEEDVQPLDQCNA